MPHVGDSIPKYSAADAGGSVQLDLIQHAAACRIKSYSLERTVNVAIYSAARASWPTGFVAVVLLGLRGPLSSAAARPDGFAEGFGFLLGFLVIAIAGVVAAFVGNVMLGIPLSAGLKHFGYRLRRHYVIAGCVFPVIGYAAYLAYDYYFSKPGPFHVPLGGRMAVFPSQTLLEIAETCVFLIACGATSGFYFWSSEKKRGAL